MSNASPPIAVVAAPLPQTDRRALSQAWFSALHLSQPSANADRRSAPAPLAQRFVAAVEQRLPVAAHASVALRTESGRVQLLIRRDGSTLRFVALCTPELRERVERALTQARYALAAKDKARC